eukprot:TRINITY_DN10799_c0_g1_i1.p1 TRINITY_DN10799_c0_g1~~TRINITY_DN10799_c0_g1_i1.p1  ORF type:complete len:223 (+),score=63.92 TRINITY_DN10799_c0_g1_i1:76-744(+)
MPPRSPSSAGFPVAPAAVRHADLVWSLQVFIYLRRAAAAGRKEVGMGHALWQEVSSYLYPSTERDPWECVWGVLEALKDTGTPNWETSLSVASTDASDPAEDGRWLSYYLDDDAAVGASERVRKHTAAGPAAWEAISARLAAPPLCFDHTELLTALDRVLYHHAGAVARVTLTHDTYGVLFGLDVVFRGGTSAKVKSPLDYVLVVHGQSAAIEADDALPEGV